METLTRTGLALLIILGGASFYLLHQHWTKLRVPRLLLDLGPLRPGATTLVYFTTPTCVPCKTIQRPAIQKASQILGDALQVLEIDASERPEIAQRWGVLSVPTTFVIDPRGAVRHVNHGVTRAEKLMKQIHNH
jgi:thiol-disulfide isomerase/thioredoxin